MTETFKFHVNSFICRFAEEETKKFKARKVSDTTYARHIRFLAHSIGKSSSLGVNICSQHNIVIIIIIWWLCFLFNGKLDHFVSLV